MKATENTLKRFLTQDSVQFVIPIYQRNYDWTENECKQLLNDIKEVAILQNSTHFIGSMVYIHDDVYTTAKIKELSIIDGQQRLTTITLLYVALYQYAHKNGMKNKAEEIYETLLINKFTDKKEEKIKLKQTENNLKALRYLMAGNPPREYHEYSRIIENYIFFSKQINANTFELILKGLELLLFVEVSLERGKDDPQRIFESLNSTGLELTQADLIRNYILMGLPHKQQLDIFTRYWSIIEFNAKEENSQKNKVSDLIRDYLTIKNKKIPNKNKVYEEFKKRYKERDEVFYSTTLQEIKEYSLYYNKLLNPINEKNDIIKEEIEAINKLEVNVAYPFLLSVYKDFYNNIINENTFWSVLRLVQSYVWRRFIVGLPTNTLNKIFMTLYNEVNKDSYLTSIQVALMRKKGTQKFPTDDEIKSVLKEKDMYNIQSKNKLYFFEQMEHFNNKEKVKFTNKITIEHIFPQNPSLQWKKDLPLQEYQHFQTIYLHTIANLTLSGNNGELGNKSFYEKKNMNKNQGEQGYKYSNLRINSFLKRIDEWNEFKYHERYKELINRFMIIWEYPSISINDTFDEGEYNLFDSPDPTGRKLEYYSFRDEVFTTNTFVDMYTNVIRILFEENPKMFLQTELKREIEITTHPTQLRRANPINSTYFIEVNKSSQTIFNSLKNILLKLNSTDSLIVKFES